MARRRVAWVAALAAALTFSGAVAAKPKPKPLLPKQPTQEQIQAAYDRGRATGNWKLVRAAEHFDNGGGAALSAPLVAPPSRIATPPAHEDSALRAKLAVIGRHFNGWAAFWVHDLRTGTYAGWNSDAQFPSASIGKVAVLVAGIADYGYGPGSPLDYDMRQIGSISSNLAANHIFEQVGAAKVDEALQHLGMPSTRYVGLYRTAASVGDVQKAPPSVHWGVTTAHDLGRAFLRLQAAAGGHAWAIAKLGLSREQATAALGYLRLHEVGPSLLAPPPGAVLAEKDGWISDARGSAAVAYTRNGPKIVIVLTYRPGVSDTEAKALGAKVSRLVFATR